MYLYVNICLHVYFHAHVNVNICLYGNHMDWAQVIPLKKFSFRFALYNMTLACAIPALLSSMRLL